VRIRRRADLEVGVEVGEADGGGVLERAVRLAPALQRRHCCLRRRACPRRSPSPRTPCGGGLVLLPPTVGLARPWCCEISGAGSRYTELPTFFPHPHQIGDLPPDRREARSSPSTPVEVRSETTGFVISIFGLHNYTGFVISAMSVPTARPGAAVAVAAYSSAQLSAGSQSLIRCTHAEFIHFQMGLAA